MAYEFENVSILIAEDNQPMLELVKSLVQTFGIKRVFTARDGEQAFRIFRQEQPDIIIADCMMEPMDGIALTRHIRNNPESPNQFTPIILMTGFSEKRRILHARDTGVTEFLVKPFNARDLYRRIAQIIEQPRKFVRSEDFFGPDRRRKAPKNYQGPLRRESDSKRKESAFSIG